MKKILQLFRSFLLSHGYPQPACINKGLPRDTVISELKKSFENLPDELVAFYYFQNGVP